MSGSGSWLLALALAAAAGAVLPGDPSAVLRRAAPGPAARSPARSRSGRRPLRWWVLVCPVLVWLLSASVVLGAATGVVAVAAARAVTGRSRRRTSAGRRGAVIDVVVSLSAELRGGAEPRAALAAAAADALPEVAAAARSPAADPVRALRAAAGTEGHELLADLAVAWQVVETTGAALGGPAARLASAARDAETVHRELDAQLAGPRATALLLSGLPLSGVLLGTALGADPVGFLLGSAAGRGCLLGGALLVAAGAGWTEAVVARAESP